MVSDINLLNRNKTLPIRTFICEIQRGLFLIEWQLSRDYYLFIHYVVFLLVILIKSLIFQEDITKKIVTRYFVKDHIFIVANTIVLS